MKPTVPAVLPIVQRVYAKHSAGCCWHVVLDDGNVGDEMVAICARDVGSSGECRTPDDCRALAELLPKMSRTQRNKLCRSAYKRIG